MSWTLFWAYFDRFLLKLISFKEKNLLNFFLCYNTNRFILATRTFSFIYLITFALKLFIQSTQYFLEVSLSFCVIFIAFLLCLSENLNNSLHACLFASVEKSTDINLLGNSKFSSLALWFLLRKILASP